MARISNPRLFTQQFGVSVTTLQQAGLFDPVINADTPLFIDPLLLDASAHPIIAERASEKVRERFRQIYRLLAITPRNDAIVTAIERLLQFQEVPGTCLGYTAAGVSGHGFGPKKRDRFYAVASQVVEVGRTDPDLLPLLAVLESGIGPDLISDMTTNIIIDELCESTQTFCLANGVATEGFKLGSRIWNLPRNPLSNQKRMPIILVPNDILRELPVADSWSDVVRIAGENADLRDRINEYVLNVMKDTRLSAEKKREKAAEELQKFSEAVARVGEYLAALPRQPYDAVADPHTHRAIQRIVGTVEHYAPMQTPLTEPQTPEQMLELVRAVVEQFRFLVEEKGIWTLLWDGQKRLKEHIAQKVFFAAAYAYCSHYDVHIGVEHVTGDGRTDFIFTKGSHKVVVVELKWSDNRLLHGYNTQVTRYISSEKALHAFYVILDCDDGKGYAPFALAIARQASPQTSVIHVDANRKTAPSKPPL
jgi:hypothetical protein